MSCQPTRPLPPPNHNAIHMRQILSISSQCPALHHAFLVCKKNSYSLRFFSPSAFSVSCAGLGYCECVYMQVCVTCHVQIVQTMACAGPSQWPE